MALYEDEEVEKIKKEQLTKTDPLTKIKNYLKSAPTLVIIVVIIIILAGGYYFITQGYKEDMLTKQEKGYLLSIINGNLTIDQLPYENKTAIIGKLEKDSNMNKNLLMFFGGVILLAFILFALKADNKEGYISMRTAKAIVVMDMKKTQRIEMQRYPDFDYQIEMACRMRWWGSQALGNEPVPFVWAVLVKIKKGSKWEKWLYCLDPRFTPQVSGHIFAIESVPEGFTGKEWKNLDFVPIGEPKFVDTYGD